MLGAGGMVGLAYHVGVLRALRDSTGLDPNAAEIIVGTSAGSVIAAYLRAGWAVDEISELMLGTHASLSELGDSPEERRAKTAMTPTFSSPLGLVASALGSMFVAGRSLIRIPAPGIPGPLVSLLQGGLFSMREARARLDHDLDAAWPHRSLAVCAVDVGSARRVTFGQRGAPTASVADAVQASCSIPGFYEPTRIQGRTFVDGGVHSTTNVDVATRFGVDLIIAIAPMGCVAGPGVPVGARLARSVANRQLDHEVRVAHQRGADVLVLRPEVDEVALHGYNLMRADGAEAVAELAYQHACSSFGSDRYRLALAG